MTQPTITAADREAAAQHLAGHEGWGFVGNIRKGFEDCHPLVLLLACHRQAESDRWAKAMREAVEVAYRRHPSGVPDCAHTTRDALLAAIDDTQDEGTRS